MVFLFTSLEYWSECLAVRNYIYKATLIFSGLSDSLVTCLKES